MWFHKNKHELIKLKTSGILKSTHFRNNLYQKWKLSNPDSQKYLNVKQNFEITNNIPVSNIGLTNNGGTITNSLKSIGAV